MSSTNSRDGIESDKAPWEVAFDKYAASFDLHDSPWLDMGAMDHFRDGYLMGRREVLDEAIAAVGAWEHKSWLPAAIMSRICDVLRTLMDAPKGEKT